MFSYSINVFQFLVLKTLYLDQPTRYFAKPELAFHFNAGPSSAYKNIVYLDMHPWFFSM
jgi:hypothetical protein